MRRLLVLVSLIIAMVVSPWAVDLSRTQLHAAVQSLEKSNSADPHQKPMRSMTSAQRSGARIRQGKQKVGVNRRFAGVKAQTASLSPLARGTGKPATMSAPLSSPDYFAIGNYANSPLPQLDTTGAIISGTGLRKFVDTLPGLCGPSLGGICAQNDLGQSLVVAAPDTTTYPGSDYYEISLVEYNEQMHSDLPGPLNGINPGPGTKLRGYVQTNGPLGLAQSPSYLGPMIIATKNRPVRVRFTNKLPTGSGGDLFIPTDTSLMGAGMGPDGTSYTQNRATAHLHGGNSPWISDGTPHQWTAPAGENTNFPKGVSASNVPDMWFDANGNTITSCAGLTTCSVTGATNDPGPGSLTFYWTNQQSGRFMFYHDHSYGITRLNVYAGEAAGYLIVDPTEESSLAAATVPGTIGTTTPDYAHMIPLIIQDKTFVPDNGTAGGQLAATDPTWSVAQYGGMGNLWFPHVYTPNQNPADPGGANPFGRWDYGPWFWPPQDPSTFVPQGMPVECTSAAFPGQTLVCPGTPNPSLTPEAFMDTPVINGTAYPKLQAEPAAYRFKILNASNDRSINLQLYVADPLSVAVTNGGSGYTSPPTVSFSGGGGSGATANAIVSGGSVFSIAVTSGGTGYTAPAVSFSGGGGTGATANALVLNGIITGFQITNGGTGYTSAPTVVITDATGTGATAAATITPPGVVTGITVTNPGTGWTGAPTVTLTGGGGTGAAAVASINTEVKMVDAVPHTATSALPACAANAAPDPVTGLPINCWPATWPTDGRDGGVPDPLTAGPQIIQIGTEGGLLPKPAIIPSTPVGYEYNRRSITVLNVFSHGLLLGPAERADIVVDFSAFAGKTLILYNDSPAPIPAFDSRLDYYTGDPDQTVQGGAPTTMPGYGPNTRTMMQIQVSATGTPNGFSLNTLQSQMPAIYSVSQPAPIVPQGVYARIQDTSLTLGPTSLTSISLTNGGSGYTSAPKITLVGTGTTQATAVATVPGSGLKAITVTNPGSGYSAAPQVHISGGGGTGATARATISGGKITAITLTNPGSGYTSPPTVSFSGGGFTGRGAAATAVQAGSPISAITLTNAGAGYTTAPYVLITGGGGTGASATANLANTFPLQSKCIQELFTLDYGRMNATLGVEMPFTNFTIQTTIPYGFIDPPTEIIKDGDTQLWKITHNGVDTHFIHFHMFDVQLVNRIGWDGAVKPPDPNETGWKDTVRMNPLEDVVVAMRPSTITLPSGWNLPNSVRPLDPTQPLGTTTQFTGVDPTNKPAPVLNELTNFGWEYVWHCHILGHEENDMMRSVIKVVAPKAPSNLSVAAKTIPKRRIDLSWKNNASNQTGFIVQRATNSAFTAGLRTFPTLGPNAITYSDTTVSGGTTYYYRVAATNVTGYNATPGYPTVASNSGYVTSAAVIAK